MSAPVTRLLLTAAMAGVLAVLVLVLVPKAAIPYVLGLFIVMGTACTITAILMDRRNH